jgi:hypothetical protein
VAADQQDASAVIYLSKPAPGTPRYVAERSRGRLLWWASPTNKVADLQLVTAAEVPHKVRRQIIRTRYREATR